MYEGLDRIMMVWCDFGVIKIMAAVWNKSRIIAIWNNWRKVLNNGT